jgi:uncharacterized membrane protein YhaH (DUF805 family)
MGNYLNPWRKFATFSGRATRGEYWTFVLVNYVIILALFIPSFGGDISPISYASFALGVAAIIPTLAVLVRRLHDSGRSGAWFFITFVPFIGGVWLLILTLLGGTPGPNQYGNNPRGA